MTTIAYDGRFVASDSLLCIGGSKSSESIDKLIPSASGKLYSLTGLASVVYPWIEWYEQVGRDQQNGPQLPKVSRDEDNSNFLVFDYEKGWQMFSLACPYAIWRKEPWAWGSGADHAITALDARLSVTQAIILAAKRDPHTDDLVKVYDLKNREFMA